MSKQHWLLLLTQELRMNRQLQFKMMQEGLLVWRQVSKLLSNLQDPEVDAALEADAIADRYELLSKARSGFQDSRYLSQIGQAFEVSACVLRWRQAVWDAEPSADRHLQAAHLRARRQLDMMADERSGRGFESWLTSVLMIRQPDEVISTVRRLKSYFRPTPYFGEKPVEVPRAVLALRRNDSDAVPDSTPLVVRISLLLDQQHVVNPQLLRTKTIHSLEVQLTATRWPAGCVGMRVFFVTTMNPDLYTIDEFEIRLYHDRTSGSASGSLVLKYPQSNTRPVVLKAAVELLGGPQPPLEMTLIGQNELRLLPIESYRYPRLSGYPTIDAQIPPIMQQVEEHIRLEADCRGDLLDLLVALTRYAGMTVQGGVFKGRDVAEVADFQPHVRDQLRMLLGPSVSEGTERAGGETDLVYNNIVVELKVERKLKDRGRLRRKYIEQPAQYSAHSLPVSIVCILDVVEKTAPPGNIANNLFVELPELHGFEGSQPSYPSVVIVLIIDGNTKRPSDYS